jgi:hypothetical protein
MPQERSDSIANDVLERLDIHGFAQCVAADVSVLFVRPKRRESQSFMARGGR